MGYMNNHVEPKYRRVEDAAVPDSDVVGRINVILLFLEKQLPDALVIPRLSQTFPWRLIHWYHDP